jgi:hypothetical protein
MDALSVFARERCALVCVGRFDRSAIDAREGNLTYAS